MRNQKLTSEIIDARLINKNILRIGDYDGPLIKIKWKCLNVGCGHMWVKVPGSILSHNSGCPKCKRSTGELEIEKILKKQ